MALVLAPDWMISCAMSSSSGKKRAVRRMMIGRPRGVVHHAAEMLGRELADAVDVARLERRHLLVDPERPVDAALVRLADLLGDHQRGGRGEDEAVDRRARRRRLLQQVERALDVGRDELRGVVRRDMRLVQRAGMDDAPGCDGRGSILRTRSRSATEPTMSVCRRRHRIEADHRVAGALQPRHEVWPSQPDEPVTRMFIYSPACARALPAGGPPARRRRSRRSGSRTGGAS